jgi:hypothetical protein
LLVSKVTDTQMLQSILRCHVPNPADQLWGVISRGVANKTQLLDVDDCMEAIRTELRKPSIQFKSSAPLGTGEVKSQVLV